MIKFKDNKNLFESHEPVGKKNWSIEQFLSESVEIGVVVSYSNLNIFRVIQEKKIILTI